MSAQLFKGWASHVGMDELPRGGLGMFGRSGPTYRYDRTLEQALVDEGNAFLGTDFVNHEAMWNVYDGISGVGFHHDHLWPYIAIVSFGAESEFMLDPCARDNNDTLHFTLEHGDLLYVPEHMNEGYAHAVKSFDDRWSLVLRPQRVLAFSNIMPAACPNHEHAYNECLGGAIGINSEDRAHEYELRAS